MARLVERFMATDRAIAEVRKKAKGLQAVPLTCRYPFSCGLFRHPGTIQIIQSKQRLDRAVVPTYLSRGGMAARRDRGSFSGQAGPMEAKARTTMPFNPDIEAAAAEFHRAIIVAFSNALQARRLSPMAAMSLVERDEV